MSGGLKIRVSVVHPMDSDKFIEQRGRTDYPKYGSTPLISMRLYKAATSCLRKSVSDAILPPRPSEFTLHPRSAKDPAS
jgi:hypothetical protein